MQARSPRRLRWSGHSTWPRLRFRKACRWQNSLRLVDLEPLRTALAAEAGLQGVRAERIERGVTLAGEVASQAAVERTLDLAAASLPEGMPVASELRLVDLEPLRALMAAEAGLDRVHVQGSRRSVSLSGDVDSPELADRAIRLAAASLPEGMPVDDNLNVGLGLASLRAVMSGEPGLEGVRVQRVGRGVALTGRVASAEAAERTYRLAGRLASEKHAGREQSSRRVRYRAASGGSGGGARTGACAGPAPGPRRGPRGRRRFARGGRPGAPGCRSLIAGRSPGREQPVRGPGPCTASRAPGT